MLAHELCSYSRHQSQLIQLQSSETNSLHFTQTYPTFADLSEDFSGVLLGDLGLFSGMSPVNSHQAESPRLISVSEEKTHDVKTTSSSTSSTIV